MEGIKKNRMVILELKDTITKTKSLVDGLNSRTERTKERIRESKQQKANRKKLTNEQSLS